MASHPDLQIEQAHIDRAYERVAALRASAAELLETVLRQRGGTPGSLAERDVIVRTTLVRLDQLDVGRESLCFGRIDRTDGEAFHIGRLAVSSEDQEPLVVDWRAPVAEPFYRATGVDTMGLVRRRHFATEGRRLLGIEDEVFGVLGGADGSPSVDGDGVSEDDGALASAAPGTLLTALERARSGRMRDIVATVQKEQDEVIRADLGGVLVVQGGPGTGKTAVALHRAAYLLYTHRFPLERQGVLVVGPNPLFLRYIEQVLPSLGENGVVLSTIAGLVPDARVRGVDSALAAGVKADPRMVDFVADAVADRQRPLRKDLEVGFEGFLLRVPAVATARMVAAVQRRPGTHNARRRQVEGLLSRLLHQQYRQSAGRRLAAGLARPRDEELDGDEDQGQDDDGWRDDLAQGEMSEAALWARVRELPVVAEALDRMWPVLTPEELLHDLYGAPALIRLAARGRLSEEEQAALVRPRSADIESIPWTATDLPLLDEARVLLGARRPGSRRSGEVRQYGHIVADEAQDLTPMQLRMLARRSLSGSMTVAGDIAQATGPRSLTDWVEVTSFLPDQRPARVVELSVNYRTPAEVMALASKLLAVTAPHLRPPLSARSTGEQPVVEQVSPECLTARVAAVAAAEAEVIAPGTVAVIVPPSLVAPTEAALVEAGLAFASAERDGIDAPVTVIPVGTVKGLEFDSVVVVEPARLVGESPQGLRSLYVALTRATRRLTLVHSEPLPAPLTAPD